MELTIQQIKELIKNDKFVAQLNDNAKKEILAVSGCSCGWNKVINVLATENAHVIEEWIKNNA
jgi:hypothetical protein